MKQRAVQIFMRAHRIRGPRLGDGAEAHRPTQHGRLGNKQRARAIEPRCAHRAIDELERLLRGPQLGGFVQRSARGGLPIAPLAVADLKNVPARANCRGDFDAGAIETGEAGDAGDSNRVGKRGRHQRRRSATVH